MTPTGLRLPRLALPDLDGAGEIVRFMWDEGLPGDSLFWRRLVRAVLEPAGGIDGTEDNPEMTKRGRRADLALRRFGVCGGHRALLFVRNQRSKRLSTAFDGPTLYGVGAGATEFFCKIGEGG